MDKNAQGAGVPKCLGAGRLRCGPEWKAPAHAHGFHEMVVLFGGRLTLHTSAGELEVSTGDAVLYPPGLRHQEQGRGHALLDMAYFSFRGRAPGALRVVRDREGRLRVLTGWLLQEQSSGYAGKDRVMNALLGTLLAEFEKLDGASGPALVEQVRAMLKDHLHEPLTVADLASHAQMSRAHFIRTYKRLCGLTPMSDLRRMRVDAARDLLITTALPLKTIARSVGFCDEYHLSRVFQRQLQVPPGYFRKR